MARQVPIHRITPIRISPGGKPPNRRPTSFATTFHLAHLSSCPSPFSLLPPLLSSHLLLHASLSHPLFGNNPSHIAYIWSACRRKPALQTYFCHPATILQPNASARMHAAVTGVALGLLASTVHMLHDNACCALSCDREPSGPCHTYRTCRLPPHRNIHPRLSPAHHAPFEIRFPRPICRSHLPRPDNKKTGALQGARSVREPRLFISKAPPEQLSHSPQRDQP